MTEDEARAWLDERFGVSRGTRLAEFVALVIEEAGQQNLVSRATIDSIWRRHVVDSAQLVPLANDVPAGIWIDIGSGAGFPGMVAALLCDRDVMLVEPRRRRAIFLEHAAASLGLGGRVTVACRKIEQIRGRAAILSARAVAPLPELFAAAVHLSTSKTRWLLPKGRSALQEVADARIGWHGVFHVEQSLTDPDSMIVLAEKVARR